MSSVPIVGSRVGDWLLVGPCSRRTGVLYIRARCGCGLERDVQISAINAGRSMRCFKCAMRRRRTDDKSVSELRDIWTGMRARCNKASHPRYALYGGRGIRVCPKWNDSFDAFREDVGARPSKKHSLDRIDNGRGYEPGNVRWALRQEQMRNTRANRLVTHRGRTQCVKAWADELGISQFTIYMRLRRGWSDSQSLRPVGITRRGAAGGHFWAEAK